MKRDNHIFKHGVIKGNMSPTLSKFNANFTYEMIHSGATVLIVSHSMDTIMKNCERVVWIEKGKFMMIGEAKEDRGEYERMNEE